MERWLDGFDHVGPNDVLLEYDAFDGVAPTIVPGLTGAGKAILMPATGLALTKLIPGENATAIVGERIDLASAGGDFWFFLDGATEQVRIGIDAGGHIYAKRGATLLGISDRAIFMGTQHFFEAAVLFATTAVGTITVDVDGVNVLALTGIQTSATADAYCTALQFVNNAVGGTSQPPWVFDDLYIFDGSAGQNNAMRGDCRVDTSFPDANGRAVQLTPSPDVPNYENVDEQAEDGDLSYNASDTVGQFDAYAQSPAATTAVYGVQIVVCARKDNSAARTLAIGAGDGSAETYDGGHALTGAYAFYSWVLDEDPRTSTPWSPTTLETLQPAVKVAA